MLLEIRAENDDEIQQTALTCGPQQRPLPSDFCFSDTTVQY